MVKIIGFRVILSEFIPAVPVRDLWKIVYAL